MMTGFQYVQRLLLMDFPDKSLANARRNDGIMPAKEKMEVHFFIVDVFDDDFLLRDDMPVKQMGIINLQAFLFSVELQMKELINAIIYQTKTL